jgi:CheY-like chemotaxis protein
MRLLVPDPENKPDHPAVAVVYVLLGLLIVLAVSYIAFALYGTRSPELATITTFVTQGLLLVIKDKYDKSEKNKRLAINDQQENDRRKVVLFVDDNLVIQDMLRKAFRRVRFNADLFIASSVEVAFDMLAQKEPYQYYPLPDIVVLDMLFPDGMLQGTDFLQKKLNDPIIFDIPVVLISAYEKEKFAAHIDLIDTCCAYVKKGNPAILLQAINQCLGGDQMDTISIRAINNSGPQKLLLHDEE